jgi:aryl-alcohol dehydrogenase-like predicted oxidoreductase
LTLHHVEQVSECREVLARFGGRTFASKITVMKHRTFGRAGVSVSEIGFGAWAIGGGWGQQSDDESLKALNRALDLGVNVIDTAAGYGNGHSERLIAKVLEERKLTGKVYVATKTPPQSNGPWPPSPYCRWDERYPESYLRSNVEERLRNLKTDTIDLLQLHTWTRAWNDDPQPLLILRKLQKEGKIRHVGVSTPEHDQNCVVQLMRAGVLDAVQVIYNLFDQEPAAQLLPAAKAANVGIIVRVVFDESSLTGKFTKETKFAPDDFRANYFAGDRLERTIKRVDEVRKDIDGSGYTLPQIALRFALDHPAVGTVIPGIRTVNQAQLNCAVSDMKPIPDPLMHKLRRHNWRRGIWYAGK